MIVDDDQKLNSTMVIAIASAPHPRKHSSNPARIIRAVSFGNVHLQAGPTSGCCLNLANRYDCEVLLVLELSTTTASSETHGEQAERWGCNLPHYVSSPW